MADINTNEYQEKFYSSGIRRNGFIMDYNPFYNKRSNGGYSTNTSEYPTLPGATVLCNCVGFANGAFNETYVRVKQKTYPTFKEGQYFPLHNGASKFISDAKSMPGLAKYVIDEDHLDQIPPVGGLIVWSSDDKTINHVAYISQVHDDNSITIIQAGWNTRSWSVRNKKNTGWCCYEKRIYRNGTSPHKYKNCWPYSDNAEKKWSLKCLGYIINPAVVEYAALHGDPCDGESIGGTTIPSMETCGAYVGDTFYAPKIWTGSDWQLPTPMIFDGSTWREAKK